MIAWKMGEIGCDAVLIKLDIPEDARVKMFGDMGKCDKAWCDDITDLDEEEHFEQCESCHDPDFIYYVGEMAYPNGFIPGSNGPGLYFFTKKEDAKRF